MYIYHLSISLLFLFVAVHGTVEPALSFVSRCRTICSSTTADVSKKADALRVLGDYFSISSTIDSSKTYYKRSWELNKTDLNGIAYAKTLIIDGEYDEAELLIKELSGSFCTATSASAGILLGKCYFLQGKVKQAKICYAMVSELNEATTIASAVLGEYRVAVFYGDSLRCDILKKRIHIEFHGLLELINNNMLDNDTVLIGNSSKSGVVDNKNNREAWTIQVGAFGSKENADRMITQMKRTFGYVKMRCLTSGTRTLYKVRVGKFVTENEANEYAERQMKARKIVYRVVAVD